MTRLDWSKPVTSLVHKLQKAGLKIAAVNDGGETIKINVDKQLEARKKAVEAITSVDTSTLFLDIPGGGQARVFVVLGNDPDEIVADWAYRGDTIGVRLDSAIDEYISQWEGKKCPKITA